VGKEKSQLLTPVEVFTGSLYDTVGEESNPLLGAT